MGQRSQIIIFYPKMEYNQGNPNNYKAGVEVYHNQWRYGHNLLEKGLLTINAIIKLIGISKRDLSRFPIDYKEIIPKAVKFADYSDINDMRESFKTYGFKHYEKEKDEPIEDFKDFKEFRNYQDNNNGYFIIMIDEKSNVKFTIISGLEDDTEEHYISPMDYLKLFYKPDELIKNTAWEYIKTVEELNKIPKGNPEIYFKKLIGGEEDK